ncbi:hypothetical protein ACFVW1_14275 [Streptomyces olivochromogenes]|uniref:hypothetical protein n=1 Tax=Streptomyces olivochromogenes TaxID=1963 RepID=UPI0036DE41A6
MTPGSEVVRGYGHQAKLASASSQANGLGIILAPLAVEAGGSYATGGWNVATDVWGVLDEAQRLPWSFTPFECVGPLKFGMTHDQVRAAVDGVLSIGVSQGYAGSEVWAEFDLEQRPDARFSGPAVTVYYDQSIGLAGVAVNALRGPQVTLAEIRLVGQVPSRLEDQFTDYLTVHGKELRYSQSADPCSSHLGLALRVQRAGDLVLSRPVMVTEAWADRCWDTSEGCIPEKEWKTFEW